MNIILLKEKLTSHELFRILTEFPQYKLAVAPNDDLSNLTSDQLAQVEIIYGDRLTENELPLVPQLRWIHAPHPYVEKICMDRIRQQGHVLVSTTKEEDLEQIGELAMSGILAFSKNLFHWHGADHQALAKNESLWKESMWTARNRTLLQVGLGMVGSEIARQGKRMGLNVWGVQDPPSFHPNCHKTLPMKELHAVLSQADIVCLSWPRDQQSGIWFKKHEMDLMKKGAILLIFGTGSVVDMEALAHPEVTSKLRGMMIDAHFPRPISSDSPLRKLNHVLLTPEVGANPKSKEGQAFRTFLFNMRQFLHGNYSDMKNLVGYTMPALSEILASEES